VEAGHAAGIPVILHSCGNMGEVMEDIITGMQYDAKHSFEDVIIPVEDFYRTWGDRIAVLGGMDMDFIARQTPGAIRRRCEAMLALGKTGYALGTGNSVPEYIPDSHYFAMTGTVLRP
jgi:uroporphyrinogen decarboxylase